MAIASRRGRKDETMRLLTLAVLLAAASPAWAWDEDYRHGRIRYVEPGVALQRADEANADEAVANFPFLPGDRVWTDGGGRVEFQFQDGTLIRLDSRSKIDYVAHDERDDRVILRLWSGSAWVVTRERGSYEIETPTALAVPRERTTVRIDADTAETRLSVFEGEATFESGRQAVDVREGERTWGERGRAPEDPRRFDRRAADDFQAWSESRDDRTAYASAPSYVPEAVRPYAGELETSGSWYFVAEVGHVWRPYVASGWAPYTNGRWAWTRYGWTWVPYDPWGWATFHYGRWDWGPGVGWYWIPGQVWGPAWVSWSVGGGYVGWCPLGYRDRPAHHGYAPHGGQRGAWSYARQGDLGAADLARRRVDLQADRIAEMRVADTPLARPTRDGRSLDVQTAVPRSGGVPTNVRMRHSPGDTVPEIAQDNKVAVPAPVVRRPRPRDEAEPRNDVRPDPARGGERDTGDRDVSTGRGEVAAPRSYSRRDDDQQGGAAAPVPSRPRDTGTTGYSRDRDSGSRQAPPPTAAPRSRENDADRDVLRRMFRPLSERPSSSGDSGRSAAPRSEPRPTPRSEPRVAAPRSEPRSAPPPRTDTQRPTSSASPRAKDRDNR